MALTKNFKEMVQARALRNTKFRRGLLTEAIESLLADDLETGKALLRDYINATIGFEKLAAETHLKPKSIMRSLSVDGNPTSKNLFNILHTLQQREGTTLTVHAK
jgi:DNA-binding phage protein